MVKPVSIIGTGSGWGAKDMGTAYGPSALLKGWDLDSSLPPQLTFWHDEAPVRHSSIPLSDEEANQRYDRILKITLDLSQRVYEALSAQHFPLILGGDHSVAIGTWSGVKKHSPLEDFGLIWIDAHMDAHTPQSSPSRSIHGMPLATLLGHGDPALCDLSTKGPKLKPENVVVMGARSYEKEEDDLLRSLGVRIIAMPEIAQHGFTLLFEEALAIATQGRALKFGISIDVDAFDPKEVPGTGTPEANGFYYQDVKESLHGIFNHPLLIAAEIMELNPLLDEDNCSILFVRKLITLMKGN